MTGEAAQAEDVEEVVWMGCKEGTPFRLEDSDVVHTLQ